MFWEVIHCVKREERRDMETAGSWKKKRARFWAAPRPPACLPLPSPSPSPARPVFDYRARDATQDAAGNPGAFLVLFLVEGRAPKACFQWPGQPEHLGHHGNMLLDFFFDDSRVSFYSKFAQNDKICEGGVGGSGEMSTWMACGSHYRD